MKNTISDLFNMLCEIYINKHKKFNVTMIFAQVSEYSSEYLKEALEANRELLLTAKEQLLLECNYQYDFVEGNTITRFSFPREQLSSYINNIDIDPHNVLFKKKELYNLLKVAFVYYFANQKIMINNNRLERYEELHNRKENKRIYYRGQINIDWRIFPSLLRGLNKNVVIDDNSYFKMLSDAGLEDKFNENLRTHDTNTYDKYAFIQHACSFSPFIDFTKNIQIATSFALSNSSRINEFMTVNSNVIALDFMDIEKNIVTDKYKAKEFIKKRFKMKYIDTNTFILGKPYRLIKSDGSYEIIKICSIKTLFDALIPSYVIIDIPTNDRMKYQKGVFICFYDCLCLRNFVAYELIKGISFTSNEINVINKRSILDSIYKERKYSPENLLNPYHYFNE